MPPFRTAVAAACTLAVLAAPAEAKKDKTVDVQVLALNDLHGNLEAPGGSGGRVGDVPAGGVEYLATHVKRLEATNKRHTTVVSAGDLIGASPLLSALFHDEPTIEAMNAVGLDLNAVGNHEFDEGAAELRRMQDGGCHPVDGCQDGDGFGGAQFGFLAANVVDTATGRTFFPPYAIEEYDGEKVAYIGMTLEGTPDIVSPSGIRGLEFRDEAETVNRLVPKLRSQGAKTIVVLVHEGGLPGADSDGCPVSGAIVDIVERTSKEVDLFVTGHTHQAYSCTIDGRPVTSASSNGRRITDIDLKISRGSGQPVEIRRNNRVVTRDVAKDEAQTALIARYKQLAAPIENRVIGSTSAPITRAATPAGESALGDVIADAQLAATDDPALGGAELALMNPGGIRADLDQGPVTYGESFTVQPFGNNLVTVTLTGAQLVAVLDQQLPTRILQVSNGFSYTYAVRDGAVAVDPASLRLGGTPITPSTSLRVTINSFLADGGDGFTVFRDGTDRLGGVVDTDALEAYFRTASPVAPGPQDRITRVG